MDAELAKLVKVVTPDHEEWEERSSRWNKFTETKKEVCLIAVPSTTDDVVAIVNWARHHEQKDITVRGGGHGFFSAAEIVVDMRDGFSYATVIEEEAIATIGMGQTLGQIDERTHPWHVPFGVVSHTGCGLLITGGVGYMAKSKGTSSDNIVEVTIVTSDGGIHKSSADNEPDLFFAVRGAAPNLGIVTEVKAKVYKQPDAFCTLLAWPLTHESFKRCIDWSDQKSVLNDVNITCYAALAPSPDMDAHLCMLHVVCVGDEDEKYKELLSQLDNTGEITLLPKSRVPWSTPQTIFDAAFPDQFWYMTQSYFPGDVTVPEDNIKNVVDAYSGLELGLLHPLVIYEQRGNSTLPYHQLKDNCTQPRFD